MSDGIKCAPNQIEWWNTFLNTSINLLEILSNSKSCGTQLEHINSSYG